MQTSRIQCSPRSHDRLHHLRERSPAIQGGRIVICGHDVGTGKSNRAELRRDVGMVFQSYNLFPHFTVERNITLALTLVKKNSKTEAQRIAAEVLALVGLADKSASYPEQLSGGQQQRVTIARSLALSPQVIAQI